MLPHRRPNANVSLERSKSCPGLIYGYFSVRSFPLTRHSHDLVLDVGSDAATAGLRPFRFEIPKSCSDSSTLQEVNQNQAYNSKCSFFYLLYACSYTNKMTHKWFSYVVREEFYEIVCSMSNLTSKDCVAKCESDVWSTTNW